MLRTFGVIAMLLAATSVATAADYGCRSLAGEPEARLDFTVSHSSNAYAVLGAEVSVHGGRSFATDPHRPGREVRVNSVAITDSEIAFGLGPHYGDDEGEVARVHVVTLGPDLGVTAGVLSLPGVGAWPIACDVK